MKVLRLAVEVDDNGRPTRVLYNTFEGRAARGTLLGLGINLMALRDGIDATAIVTKIVSEGFLREPAALRMDLFPPEPAR